MSYDFEIGPAEYRHDIWERNITYNLGKMFRRAGFHPHFCAGRTVKELRPVVTDALCVLRDNPDYFRKLNPPIDPDTGQRWGDYAGAVEFLQELLRYLSGAPEDYVLKVM